MRALVSVSDKTGVVEFADALVDLGWEVVSSGGTASALRAAGVACTDVETVTASGEMLGGRVKTLHPTIHGGILADRDKPDHMADLEARGIVPIDLVVCNLYPFSTEPSIEMIDVGGPTMVRAAAKNQAHVGVVVDPSEYGTVLDEIRRRGHLSGATRRRLARAAFAHTAAYDAAIVEWLDARTEPGELPATVHLTLERAQELRYGENPHQKAARYRRAGTVDWWDHVVQHGGMALSYLNLVDADAAWALVHDLGDAPAAVIIKHANPCGAAVAATAAEAYRRAFESDPMSAFGGIVALNRPVDDDLAEEMVANPKADVVVAPGYSLGAVERFAARRKNMRVLEASPPDPPGLHLRQIGSAFLGQEPYRFGSRREGWRIATGVVPTDDQWRDLELAWRICAHVKSNAIVIVTGGMAVGVGAGQQNRVEAGELAVRKAGDRAKGGSAASDAFFPFRDGLDALAHAGVAAVIQPGGSIRDEELVAAADEHGMVMVLTGERQFRH